MRNPRPKPVRGASGTPTQLNAAAPRRESLDARQAAALLGAAGRHRPLIRTALMAGGLRASEVTNLRWRDVRLAGGKLQVAESKTDAGVREIDLAGDLLHELRAHKARARWKRSERFRLPASTAAGPAIEAPSRGS